MTKTRRTRKAQKAGLTRALNRLAEADPGRKVQAHVEVLAECKRTRDEWETGGPDYLAGVWPDDWHTWNMAALDSAAALGYRSVLSLENL